MARWHDIKTAKSTPVVPERTLLARQRQAATGIWSPGFTGLAMGDTSDSDVMRAITANQAYDPLSDIQKLLPTQFAQATPAKRGAGGDSARILEEMRALGAGDKDFAHDIAKWGVSSLADIKPIQLNIGGKPTDFFINTANNTILPSGVGGTGDTGGKSFKLRNVNGQLGFETGRKTGGTGAFLKDAATIIAIGAGLASLPTIGATGAAGGAGAGGAGAATGAAGGAGAATGAAASGTGLASLPAAGTWAQTALPALGTSAGQWTLPASLAGVSGATAAGGLTLSDTLLSANASGSYGTSAGAPSGVAPSQTGVGASGGETLGGAPVEEAVIQPAERGILGTLEQAYNSPLSQTVRLASNLLQAGGGAALAGAGAPGVPTPAAQATPNLPAAPDLPNIDTIINQARRSTAQLTRKRRGRGSTILTQSGGPYEIFENPY